jgi:transposase
LREQEGNAASWAGFAPQVKALGAGDSGEAIAKRVGVSSQTVHNIKKAAGLVQARKKKAKK